MYLFKTAKASAVTEAFLCSVSIIAVRRLYFANASCLFSIGYGFRVLTRLKQVRRDDGDGCDRGGFGAEDTGTEGDGRPVMGGEEGHLFRRPAAFRAYGQSVGDWGWRRVYVTPIAVRLRWVGHPIVCSGS